MTARGGKGIAVVVDHLDVSQVEKLVAEIRAEHGKLHVLVNDISESAEHEFGKTFWQADLERGSPYSAMRFIRISSPVTARRRC